MSFSTDDMNSVSDRLTRVELAADWLKGPTYQSFSNYFSEENVKPTKVSRVY